LAPEQAENVISYGGKQWSEKYHGGWADWFRPRWEALTGSPRGSVYAGGGIFQTVEFAVKACNQANTLDSDVLAEYVRHNVITTTLYDAILDDRGANILCRYTAVQYKGGIPKTLWPLDIAEAKAVFRHKR